MRSHTSPKSNRGDPLVKRAARGDDRTRRGCFAGMRSGELRSGVSHKERRVHSQRTGAVGSRVRSGLRGETPRDRLTTSVNQRVACRRLLLDSAQSRVSATLPASTDASAASGVPASVSTGVEVHVLASYWTVENSPGKILCVMKSAF